MIIQILQLIFGQIEVIEQSHLRPLASTESIRVTKFFKFLFALFCIYASLVHIMN